MQPSAHPAPAVSIWFLAVACLFVTCLVISNIVAAKLALIVGLILPAAVILFPVSYILGDVLTEVYGYARARQVIWIGFGCNLLAVIFIALAGALPAAGFWDGQEAYQRILGQTPRILAASFLAYLAAVVLIVLGVVGVVGTAISARSDRRTAPFTPTTSTEPEPMSAPAASSGS